MGHKNATFFFCTSVEHFLYLNTLLNLDLLRYSDAPYHFKLSRDHRSPQLPAICFCQPHLTL